MYASRRISASMGGPLRSALAVSLIWIPFTLGVSAHASAQTTAQEAAQGAEPTASIVVPQQVRYAGKMADRTGATVEAEFRIYAAQEGGDPLWTETQQVTVGQDGSYSVLLGGASPTGLPQTVFAGGAARWLGVSVDRGQELDRVLLSSVPYAMKSADAESLAGHAAADFVTQAQLAALAGQRSAVPAPDVQPETSGTVTGSGTAGTVPLWTGALTQGNSEIVQVGSDIGINEATPGATLDVGGTATIRGATTIEGTTTLPPQAPATTASGYASQLLDFSASAWSSTAAAPVNQTFRMFSYFAGNNTATPSGTLNFQFQEGTAPVANILSIASNGVIGFNSAQTFPGTIKSVSAASPVTAATTAGAVSLGLNTAALETTLNGIYAQLGAANTFTKPITFAPGQTFPVTGTGGGTITGITTTSPLTGSGTAGSVALGLNQSALVSDITFTLQTTFNSVYAQLGAANTFTKPITFAPGQTFPGGSGGTITGVTAGFGLTGGGTSGSPTLAVNTAVVPLLSGASFSGGISGASSVKHATAVYASGTNGAYGVGGVSDTSFGTYGYSKSPPPGIAGVFGFTGTSYSQEYYDQADYYAAGVWADTTGAGTGIPVGLMATGVDAYAGFFANDSSTYPAIQVENEAGAGISAVAGPSVGSGCCDGVEGTSRLGGSGVVGNAENPAQANAGVLGLVTTNPNGTYMSYNVVAGVWGDDPTASVSGGEWNVGVMGSAIGSPAGAFFNDSASFPTMYAQNNDDGPTGLFKTLMAVSKDGTCGIGSGGSLTCTGQVKTLATTGGGARKVETYSMQSPENWMEDFGSGELERGVALVKIDPAFAETVTADTSYHVFITPNGDSKGLYVIRKTAASFEVRESGGGTSSLTFDYRIVAKRRGYEAQRLTDVTERFNTEQKAATVVRLQPRPQPEFLRIPRTKGTARVLTGIRPAVQKAAAIQRERATQP